MAFQSVAGLPLDGVLGAETLTAMRKFISQPGVGAQQVYREVDTGSYVCPDKSSWKLESALELQRWLLCHNYLENGRRTGVIDIPTAKAIEAFQGVASLPVTGVFDEETRQTMLGASSKVQHSCGTQLVKAASDVDGIKNFLQCKFKCRCCA